MTYRRFILPSESATPAASAAFAANGAVAEAATLAASAAIAANDTECSSCSECSNPWTVPPHVACAACAHCTDEPLCGAGRMREPCLNAEPIRLCSAYLAIGEIE
jgi:hypothetical protein